MFCHPVRGVVGLSAGDHNGLLVPVAQDRLSQSTRPLTCSWSPVRDIVRVRVGLGTQEIRRGILALQQGSFFPEQLSLLFSASQADGGMQCNNSSMCCQ